MNILFFYQNAIYFLKVLMIKFLNACSTIRENLGWADRCRAHSQMEFYNKPHCDCRGLGFNSLVYCSTCLKSCSLWRKIRRCTELMDAVHRWLGMRKPVQSRFFVFFVVVAVSVLSSIIGQVEGDRERHVTPLRAAIHSRLSLQFLCNDINSKCKSSFFLCQKSG